MARGGLSHALQFDDRKMLPFFKETDHEGAARQCWSFGIRDGDASMKVGKSSSGCETHPAKAEPGRPVVRPCAGAGNRHGDA